VVYITTPAIPSSFMAFFSDPYSPFKILNFLSYYDNIIILNTYAAVSFTVYYTVPGKTDNVHYNGIVDSGRSMWFQQ